MMAEPAPSAEHAPDPDWDSFAADAASVGVTLDPQQVDQLRRYLRLLCEWNQRFNLTAIEAPEEILSKHFLDSLTCVPVVRARDARTLVDVGTGAGFPGLVLKIALPEVRVTLLDSLRKRVAFLHRVIAELGLEGVDALHARAEDVGRMPGQAVPGAAEAPCLREQFDLAVSRAVARLNVLAEWTLPLVRRGGAALYMKGPAPGEEVGEALKALELLGGSRPVVRELELPRVEVGRSLVLVMKNRPTPTRYPRPPGTARRHPLL